jgi:hypothetical protein
MTSPITLAQVSVADANTAVGVDASNTVYQYSSSDGATWSLQSSIGSKQMKQVSIGVDHTVCGLDPSGMIWQGSLTSSPFTWTQMPGGPLTQLSCGWAGNIWGVDSNNAIWQFTKGWARITGLLKQVTVASDGTVWGIGTDSMIYRYIGNNAWTKMPGGPIAQLSCGAATEIWGVDSSSVVWRYTSSWAKVPGQLKQVNVSSNGKACWGIGMDSSVSRYVYENQTWTPLVV